MPSKPAKANEPNKSRNKPTADAAGDIEKKIRQIKEGLTKIGADRILRIDGNDVLVVKVDLTLTVEQHEHIKKVIEKALDCKVLILEKYMSIEALIKHALEESL